MFHALCILLLLGFATKKTLPRVYPTMFSLDGSEATREVPKCAAKKAGTGVIGSWRESWRETCAHMWLLIGCIFYC